MNYREKLYSTYVSTHTSYLYGKVTLDDIKRQFPVWKKYFERFLPKEKDTKILDIGCGNGGFVYFLNSLGYRNAHGIDFSPEQIEIAKKLGIKNVECADLREFLKGKQGYYNLIFARDVIEHFNKDEILDILRLIYDSLNSGAVVIQTPNAEGPLGSKYRYGDFTHEIAFTRSSLNQVLKVAGFNDTAFYPTGPVPKGFKSAVRFLLWKGIEIMLRFYMVIEIGSFSGIFTQNIIARAKK